MQLIAHKCAPVKSGTFIISALAKFVTLPSIAGLPQHASDLPACAAWLADHLRRIGLEHVRLLPIPGPPIVYGEWLHALEHPTVLIYGHYDVVPAEPLAEWQSPPFSPEVRGPYLYGRGVADDKGQLFIHLAAIEACLRRCGRLPVNAKVLIEGEEEIGSPHLGAFLARHRDALKADVALVSDMTMAGEGRPAVPYAIRGLQSATIEITGARHDLHSGSFGGVLRNPLEVLAGMVARLHDASGRIGGSIPVIGMLKDGLGIPVVMMGFAAPSNRINAPNARLHLPDFFKGIATPMHFMQEIAAVLPARAAAHAA